MPDINRPSESETPENNAISEPEDADTCDIAVGTKAAKTVKIKIFLIIIVVNRPTTYEISSDIRH
jgi:hypothetical protein